ncbi:MAG TPA: hypothetical protein VIH99_05685 [Bdellovibrionota bacterium]|jgi:hypothetical protein
MQFLAATFLFASLAMAEPESKEPPFSTYDAQIGELDMIRNAKDLTPAQRDEVVRLYKKMEKEVLAIRAEAAEAKGELFRATMETKRDPGKEKTLKQKIAQLGVQEIDSLHALFEKLAQTTRPQLDHHYLFRALLREERRTGLEIVR